MSDVTSSYCADQSICFYYMKKRYATTSTAEVLGKISRCVALLLCCCLCSKNRRSTAPPLEALLFCGAALLYAAVVCGASLSAAAVCKCLCEVKNIESSNIVLPESREIEIDFFTFH